MSHNQPEKPPRRVVRLHHPLAQEAGTLKLDREQLHYLRNVLRLKPGHRLLVFNGKGQQWQANVTQLDKKGGALKLGDAVAATAPSRLDLTLVQGISKGDRMDTSIQKAVELGVNRVIPVMTQWGDVRLKDERLEKKLRHWQQVAISACEQCGRADVPEVASPTSLDDYLREKTRPAIYLDPRAEQSLAETMPASGTALDILIGPEGGFSDSEIRSMQENHCQGVRLGSRVLRTETAGPAVIAALQALAGDFQ